MRIFLKGILNRLVNIYKHLIGLPMRLLKYLRSLLPQSKSKDKSLKGKSKGRSRKAKSKKSR